MQPPILMLVLCVVIAGCGPQSEQRHPLPMSPNELRGMAGVASADVATTSPRLSRRIIHLRDYHFVSKPDFLAERGTDNIDQHYEKHLAQVEHVQDQHKQILAAIIRRYGMVAVYVEGITDETLAEAQESIETIRNISPQIDSIRNRLNDVQQLRQLAKSGELTNEAEEIARSLSSVLVQHRLDCCRLGAAGILCVDGILKELLPVESPAEYQAANPVIDSRTQFNQTAIEARHNALVRRMMDGPPVCVIVLGGEHDLSESVRRLGNGSVEYIRLTSEAYREVESH